MTHPGQPIAPARTPWWRALLIPPLSWWFWLGLGLLLAALSLGGQFLLLQGLLLPSSRGQAGWMGLQYGNEHLEGPVAQRHRLPAAERLELDPPRSSLSAFTLWRAPAAGLYKLEIHCDDYANLGVDGRAVLRMDPAVAAHNQAEVKVELAAGWHLLRVDLFNQVGRAYFTLKLQEPGQREPAVLQGPELRRPGLGGMDHLWDLLESLPRLLAPGLALAALGLVLLLLPATQGAGAKACLALVLAVLLPALLIPAPPYVKAPFDDRGFMGMLREKQPRYVFIGNSIVESCVDPPTLERLLGAPVASLITYGGFTAFDYLAFKNFVLASGVKPERVFFFFRGNSLTQPQARTDGEFLPVRESMSQDSEPVLERVLAGRLGLAARALDQVKAWLRAGGQLPVLKGWLSQAAAWLAWPPGLGEKPHKRRALVQGLANQRFGLDRLRGGADDLVERQQAQDDAQYDFDALVEGTFLPPILELARERGIQVVLARAAERPREDGSRPQDPRLAAYLARLQEYLARHQVRYHDFTGDPELPLSAYAAGDHIADPARFSQLMVRRMPWAFK